MIEGTLWAAAVVLGWAAGFLLVKKLLAIIGMFCLFVLVISYITAHDLKKIGAVFVLGNLVMWVTYWYITGDLPYPPEGWRAQIFR